MALGEDMTFFLALRDLWKIAQPPNFVLQLLFLKKALQIVKQINHKIVHFCYTVQTTTILVPPSFFTLSPFSVSRFEKKE